MSDGIVLDAEDIKRMIAEKYGVDVKDVIKSQYSWVVKKPKGTAKEGSGEPQAKCVSPCDML